MSGFLMTLFRLGVALCLAAPAATPPGKPGERGLVRRNGQAYWYPATILSLRDGKLEVLFDDGEGREWVTSDRITAIDLKEGSAIQARAGRGPVFYPGVILEKKGDKYVVLYDSGARETTVLAALRASRGPMKRACRVGQEVLAIWNEPYLWYPGRIVELRDDRARIAFYDGDVGWVTLDQIALVDVKRNPRVLGRWQGGPNLFPGRVLKKSGAQYHVTYDDGDEEVSSLHWLVFVIDPHDALGKNSACTPDFPAPDRLSEEEPPLPAPGPPSELKRRDTKGI